MSDRAIVAVLSQGLRASEASNLNRVFQRYTKGVFKQAAAEAYLKAIGEDS